MTTDPQTDRPRALHLLEAAYFLRDAHFRDGLSVQEIGTALRRMADEADPMVGSLARDGFGLDEIAAMPAAAPVAVSPTDRGAELERLRTENARMRHELEVMYGGAFDSLHSVQPADRAGLRERIAAALSEARRPGLGAMTEAEAVAYMADAVLSVLPPAADRAAVLREAADGFDAHADRILQGVDDMAAFVAKARQHEAATWREAAETLRRMAAGERDEQQAQQDGAETGEAEEPSPEETVRGHVLALHQIGEQLAGIESWMWEHLADTRDAAATPVAASTPSANETAGTVGGVRKQPDTETQRPDPSPQIPAPAALRIRVLREILGRIDGSSSGEDSAAEEVGASTVRTVLAEILTEMQPAAAPVAGQPPADTGEEAGRG